MPSADVRFWHKADIAGYPAHVRFRESRYAYPTGSNAKAAFFDSGMQFVSWLDSPRRWRKPEGIGPGPRPRGPPMGRALSPADRPALRV
jgi:hypothetical protein